MLKYYIFEGPDRAGKTTIVEMCERWLRERGINTMVAPQPGATELGRELRKIVKHNKDISLGTETEAMMFLLDHMAFVEEILLQTDYCVLSDRCDYISALVYQALRGVMLSRLDAFYSTVPTPKANAIFIFQVTPQNLALRGADRTAKWDRYESFPEFMQQVQNAYANIVRDHFGRLSSLLADNGEIVEIDANGGVDDVFGQVVAVLEKQIQRDQD